MGGHAGLSVHVRSPEQPAVEPTVVIASAHPLLALGVRGRLEGHGFRVVGEALTAPELVTAVRCHRPDICLVDAALPGGALAAAREARAHSRLAVVFLMSADDSDDGALAIEAVRAGAAGVLFENMDPGRLVYALRDVAAGGSAVPRMLVARLLDELQLSA
ncbi:MAG TPA: response regulator [Gaiellaceae bacterium]